jgi:hypothetical protein
MARLCGWDDGGTWVKGLVTPLLSSDSKKGLELAVDSVRSQVIGILSVRQQKPRGVGHQEHSSDRIGLE